MKVSKTAFLIFLLFAPAIQAISVSAEVQKTDSLKKLIESSNSDSLSIIYRNLLIDELMIVDTAEARVLLNKNLDLAENSGNQYLLGVSLRKAGLFFSNQGEYEIAIDYLTKAKELFKSLPGKNGAIGLAETNIIFGSVYHQQGDFTTAISLYLEAEELSALNNEYSDLRDVLSKIGDCYLKLNQFDTAGIYAEKNLKIIENLTDPFDIASVYIDYGNYLNETDRYDEGLSYYKRAEEFLDEAANFKLYHTYYYNYAFLLSRKDNYTDALSYYSKAYDAAKLSGIVFDQIDARYKMGLMHYYLSEYSSASAMLESALTEAKSINSSLLERNILDVLSYLEFERQNFRKAFEYLDLYIYAADAVSSDESRKQLNFVNAKYKDRERTMEIENLNIEKNLQEVTIQRRNLTLFGLSVILLISLIAFYTLFRNHKITKEISIQKVKMQEQKIFELEQERQIIALNSVLQGEETERSRLARDLHDGLGGLLSGIKLTLMNMKGNAVITREAIDQYDHALSLLDDSIKELRQVAHNLMPETLFRFGIKQALSDFCEGIGNKNLKINFSSYGIEKRYDEKLEIAIYRIVQELVNNSMKHSGASEIIVQLITEEKRLAVTVQDNGKGLDINSAEESSGNGLANIRSRVASFGGHFDLSSENGKGTEAIIEIKL